ncbi:hypothetical protein Desor_1705 [Desulfosporosinus orientis DSM 765]|uniref:Uncharacterized protein n=1 Tax=Desulfosporosinus orientis (strain ATCC 19365 / DSM 765 / NCIMB 8382 / VKM B-1628 / Singapore I) TaxID=768706 RepID=G7W5W9_DESOD|nr:hypothetical protein [Desulfosporosinus orientis]AET67345.1 hypothetical protein Desor_1705 [Desulfosporosinus orientis DSM 765]
MRLKKKSAMLISFTVGTLLLATTALADIASKSGYDELKDAIKLTAEQTSETFDSFTVDFSLVMKDNGKIIMNENETLKYDRKKSAKENISSGTSIYGDKNSYQSYSDKDTTIRYSEEDPIYYVTEYTKEREDQTLTNPFKEDEAEDIEKIVDALVGNLKDHVIVTDNSDGSKDLSGSLTEVQIPSLVNAVASFQLKQEFNQSGRNDSKMPHLTKDVFVKEVKGTADVNKDGILESILGTGVISGKDDQGNLHEISIEALITVSDINSTKVVKPDLTGKKVVTNVAREYGNEITNPEKFLGKFKNDIIIEKEGKFVKIGERYLEITQINAQLVAGHYYEVYKPEYENYKSATSDLNFKASFDKDQKQNAEFEIETESKDKVRGSIYLSDYDGKVNFNINTASSPYPMGIMYDSTFSPDLE